MEKYIYIISIVFVKIIFMTTIKETKVKQYLYYWLNINYNRYSTLDIL